jgi:Kef-type K+ transport system membrane component KefB
MIFVFVVKNYVVGSFEQFFTDTTLSDVFVLVCFFFCFFVVWNTNNRIWIE